MDAINRVAAIHGLWVVEDAAEAHLARYRGRPVGGLGAIGTFSFYGNKIFTSGEGGAVTVNDPQLEVRARTLRGQGVDPDRRYFFPIVGYNFRVTNLACALLCAQLERAEEIIEARRRIFTGYRERLDGIPGIGFQPIAAWAQPAPWLFCITVDEATFGRSRDDLMLHLERGGVDSRPFFRSLHELPPYRETAARRGTVLPVTDRLSATGMNLPTFAALTEGDLDLIAGLIRTAAEIR
jgi:perosamine synthetase